ncbi:MAG TPA: riboflavin biosynthesis protein RibF [Opitutus sp.]|nr:riboflavin biosynthesis protein RibF [Opitutus sp.]
MSRVLQFEGVATAELPDRPLHLAIGIFDGVHLGHRAVIETAVQSARRSGGQSAVLTFAPHPSAVLRAAQPTRLLMERPAKARVLAGMGVDAVITEAFTPEFAQISAEEFLPWLKRRLPQLAAVYVGENWRFGRDRRGDVALLLREGRAQGLHVLSAPRVNLDGEPISSSRIRSALESGDVTGANAMLGYPYFAEGVVTPGKRLGHAIGFPTLNLAWSPECKPRFGVYAVRVSGAKSLLALPAVANYGLRPTVEQTTVPRLEVNVLGACPFGAGDVVVVEWLQFIRPERKFAGVDELRTQITRDRASAQEFFRS